MLVHGYMPNHMLTGTMIPIPKVTGTVKSDNFRAITLSNIVLKVLEMAILRKYENYFGTCDYQFGFKSGLSTSACTFAVQETISYLNRNDSNVNCTLLDASKAFDQCICHHFLKNWKEKVLNLLF
jgi:hypothetical protein